MRRLQSYSMQTLLAVLTVATALLATLSYPTCDQRVANLAIASAGWVFVEREGKQYLIDGEFNDIRVSDKIAELSFGIIGGAYSKYVPLQREVLPMLSSLDGLRELSFFGTELDHSDVQRLGRLQQLTYLHVGSTKISDVSVELIAKNCKRLEQLDLSETEVTDAAIECLVRVKTLRHLDVANTNVTQQGLALFREHRPEVVVRSNW